MFVIFLCDLLVGIGIVTLSLEFAITLVFCLEIPKQ